MASRGVNRAIVLGNLGADPDTRYTAGGTAVTNISVATSETWRDKSSGETQERTEWHRVVFFARLAEIAGEYLRKGSKVYVEGRIQTRKWQNKNNVDIYTTEIIANELQMLDGKPGGGGQAKAEQQAQQHGAPSGGGASRDDYARGSRGGTPSPPPAAGSDPGFDDDLDDDIPFS